MRQIREDDEVGGWKRWGLRMCLHGALLAGFWSSARADAPGGVPSESAPHVSPKDADPVMRQNLLCGPNSLYMLLELHGVSVDHEVVGRYIPSHPEGMSLTELREASNRLGLSAEVRHCSIDELRRRFESPVIAYLVFEGKGHFVVIIGLNDGKVTMLDGTTGIQSTVSSEWLSHSWSGYIVAPAAFTNSWSLVATSVVGWIALGCLALLGRPVRGSRAGGRAATAH